MGETETGVPAGRGASARAGDTEPPGGDELYPAVGEIDGDGGEGGAPGVHGGGEPDAGGESEREAEWRVFAEGGGVSAETEDPAEGGWG